MIKFKTSYENALLEDLIDFRSNSIEVELVINGKSCLDPINLQIIQINIIGEKIDNLPQLKDLYLEWKNNQEKIKKSFCNIVFSTKYLNLQLTNTETINQYLFIWSVIIRTQLLHNKNVKILDDFTSLFYLKKNNLISEVADALRKIIKDQKSIIELIQQAPKEFY